MLKLKQKFRLERQSGVLLSGAGYDIPTRLQKTLIPLILKGKDLIIEPSDNDERLSAVLTGLILRFMRNAAEPKREKTVQCPYALLITESFTAAGTLNRLFGRIIRQSVEKPVFSTVGRVNGEKEESIKLREPVDFLAGPPGRIIDHLRRGNIKLSKIASVVIVARKECDWTGLSTDVQFICSKAARSHQTLLLTGNIGEIPARINGILRAPFILTRREGLQLESPGVSGRNGRSRNSAESIVRSNGSVVKKDTQEKRNVKTKDTEIRTDTESLKSAIDGILEKIKHDDSPEELNRLRGEIRRNVPFFMRGYFMAWLVREYYLKKGVSRPKKGETTTLFVGIGKNRKTFPRDILQLFQASAGIPKTDMGEIKVLDNYSFVDISISQAQKAIDALNGIQFRGRRINVNYAKKRDEETDSGMAARP